MKHFWFGAGLLALILILGILSLGHLKTVVGRTEQCLQTARDCAQAQAFDDAEAAVRAAMDAWEKSRGYCGTLLRHSETDDIQFYLCELREYARLGESDQFFGLLAQLEAMLAHLVEMEQVNYYNFL